MTNPPPIPKPRTAMGKRIFFVVGGLLFMLILVAVIWRVRLNQDVNTRLHAVRAAGLPLSGKELNDFYPTVTDSENAALVVTQAFPLMRYYPDARSNEVMKLRLPSPTKPLAAEQMVLLTDYVEMNAFALAKAREGISRPKSHYPIDMSPGLNALLPHLKPLRDLAQAASYEGILAADSGRQQQAVDSVLTVLSLSQTLADEPLLISKLVRFRMNKMAKDTLERCLNAGNLNGQQLTLLSRALDGAQHTNEMAQAMIGERAMMVPLFRMNFAEFERFGNAPEHNPSGAQDGPGSVFLTSLIRVTGFFERDLRFYLNVMETNVSLAKLPPPHSLAITNVEAQAFTQIPRWHFMISGILLPALSKAYTRHAESQAVLRLSRTALAVERFRLLNGRLPSDLNELVPTFLSEPQIDPFDGFALRYKPRYRGYILYSVGEDGQDNGGKAKPADPSHSKTELYDITFTVER